MMEEFDQGPFSEAFLSRISFLLIRPTWSDGRWPKVDGYYFEKIIDHTGKRDTASWIGKHVPTDIFKNIAAEWLETIEYVAKNGRSRRYKGYPLGPDEPWDAFFFPVGEKSIGFFCVEDSERERVLSELFFHLNRRSDLYLETLLMRQRLHSERHR